jgi:hypothetical protein
MKRVARLLAAIAGLFILLFLGSYALIESGEVVAIRAAPEDGGRFLARLWVVDHDGDPWIGTTDPSKTDWVPWLRAHSRLDLERSGRHGCREVRFNASPNAVSQKLNVILSAKYRIPSYGSWFLRLIGGALRDEDQRTWIRLEPCGESE